MRATRTCVRGPFKCLYLFCNWSTCTFHFHFIPLHPFLAYIDMYQRQLAGLSSDGDPGPTDHIAFGIVRTALARPIFEFKHRCEGKIKGCWLAHITVIRGGEERGRGHKAIMHETVIMITKVVHTQHLTVQVTMV